MPFRRMLLALALALAARTAAMAQSPNLVLISLDTVRADRLAPWGGSPDLAPNLNALAARGSAFASCFAPAPLTLPSHATMLTGVFPEVSGLRDNGFGTLAPGVPTLAEVLAARGYTTAAVIAAPVLDDQYGLNRGFGSYDDDMGAAVYRPGNEVTDRAIARIRAPRKGPLFLFVHYFDAHFPYNWPPAFARHTKDADYDSAVAFVDSEVGRLMKALPPDTVVAVVSDHGEGLGDHGEPTHGVFLFQATVHVVCFLQGPGVPQGKKVSGPTSLCDVARTLAALAGAPASALEGDGVDLLALARGSAPPFRAFPLESWVPFSQYRWHPLFGVTDGRYKWVRGKVDRLYDLASDPGETKNLAAAPPPDAKALKGKLPAQPAAAPSQGKVDPALLGLGYAPAPGGSYDPASLPDPYDRAFVLQAITEARIERSDGDLGKAVARLKSAAEKDTGDPSVWFEYGETLRRAGRYTEAVAALERALTISPQVYQVWTSKGHALLALEKGEEAARAYEKAVALQPDFTPAVNALAAYYLDTGKSERALTLVERAIAAGTGDFNTYLLRGQLFLMGQRTGDAAKDFELAVRLSPHPEETLKEEADTYVAVKREAEGEALYVEGTRRFPAYAPNYLALGSLSLKRGHADEALAQFRKALGLKLDAPTRRQVEGLVRKLEAGAGGAASK